MLPLTGTPARHRVGGRVPGYPGTGTEPAIRGFEPVQVKGSFRGGSKCRSLYCETSESKGGPYNSINRCGGVVDLQPL
eukprot:1043319-Rhodomonas_salina.1